MCKIPVNQLLEFVKGVKHEPDYNIPIEMIVDTGASTYTLDEDTFNQINYSNGVALEPTAKKLFAYGSPDHLETMGKFNGTFSFQGNQERNVLIHVLKAGKQRLPSQL